MRRKLLCISAAMIFGIWCAGINIILAVSLALAAFLYGKTLSWRPRTHCLRKDERHQSRGNDAKQSQDRGHGDEQKMQILVMACAVAMLVGTVRMGIQAMYYDSGIMLDQMAAASDESKAEETTNGYKSHNAETITAEVLKVSHKKDKSPKVTVRLIQMGRRYTGLISYRCLVTWSGGKEKEDVWKLTGSVIRFSGKLEKPESARNPRCFDYKMYLRSQGTAFVASTQGIKIVRENASLTGAMKGRIISFREQFIHSICSRDEQTEALLRGVLFGDTDSMDEEMKEDFRRNGTAHVLAVSALHIGLLYSIFRMLRKKLTIPGMTAVFLLILGIYGTMTLWTVSVTRAAALILLMEVRDRLDRRFDLLTSLGFVSMLVLMHEPYALYGTSFIMSYLAALSIGMICPAMERCLPDGLSSSIKTSLAVQVGLIPYIAYTFNMVPLGALIINIPVIFLLSMIVTLSAAAVPMQLIDSLMASVPVTGIFSLPQNMIKYLIAALSNLMIMINERFADLAFLSPDVLSPPLFILAGFYGILLLICSESFRIARIRKDHRMIAPQTVMILMVVILAFGLTPSDIDRADIVMVDVGQGDCMRFRFMNYLTLVENGSSKESGRNSSMQLRIPGHIDVLIDGGGSENYNIGKNTVKPYLLKNGVRQVDLALATHLHTDHYKGLQELAEEGMIRRLMTDGKTGDVIYIGKARNVSRTRKLQDVQGYDQVNKIEIIWPDVRDPDTDDENKNSLIFKVYVNGITVLVTGDIGEEAERELVERYRGTDVLDCDVLKVCHHGSKTSNSAVFIEAVSPVVALIGVGKNNPYGHPSHEAVQRLEDAGARVFRTDRDGAIGIRKTKNGLEIWKMQGG